MPPEIIGASIPILKEESSDYPKDRNDFPTYDSVIKIRQGDIPTAEISHKLEGECLVSNLLKEGKATFGCELIFLGSFRREFHVHDGDSFEGNCTQIISWNASDVSQKLFFRPVIIAQEDIDSFILSEKDRVSEFWIGAEISIPKFATLADGKERSPNVTTQSILKIGLDPDFSDFEMNVKRVSNPGRSHFVVNVGRTLHQLLNNKSKENIDLRRALLVNALTGAFGILANDFQKDPDEEMLEIEHCVVLSSLQSKLIELGVSSWCDSENFSPIHAATKFEKLTWTLNPNSMESDND